MQKMTLLSNVFARHVVVVVVVDEDEVVNDKN